jgi:choline dehydrogenase-like flavoprotein
VECPTCDSFACALGAKNDLPTSVLPKLVDKGMELRANTVALSLVRDNRDIKSLECYDKSTGRTIRLHAKRFVLSAGALGSPHLILASDLKGVNPGGHTIGRYLTRHCNAIIYGYVPTKGKVDRSQFHKQLGFHDFYFGHPDVKKPKGKLGCLQQMQTPPIAMIEAMATKPLAALISVFLSKLTGLVVMAEDQPQYQNRVEVNWDVRDGFGMPQPLVTHHYSKRDYAARKALLKQAKRILRKAGAIAFYIHNIKTFSHAVGTVRMGPDPYSSALDEYCQFRGLTNLFVVDGSFKPTAGGVNPSLTISANALRVAEQIVRNS